MGDYSYFLSQDIKVLNKKKLIEIRAKTLAFNGDYTQIISDSGEIEFHQLEECKIEGYWYEEFVEFMKTIAPYIQGEVIFNCDYGYQFKIIFKDKKVYYARQIEKPIEFTEMEELHSV